MNKIFRRMAIPIALIVATLSVAVVCPDTVYADNQFLHDETVTLSDGRTFTVHALDEGYDNNVYLSLRDMSKVLAGTRAAFTIEVTKSSVDLSFEALAEEGNTISNGDNEAAGGDGAALVGDNVTSGEDDATVEGDNDTTEGVNAISEGDTAETGETGTGNGDGWTDDEKAAYFSKVLQMNQLNINDELKKYYTIRASYSEDTDCFISFVNLAMILDINMYISGKDTLVIEPDKKLVISPEELEREGFFQDINSVLVGDATTGQIFYEYNGNVAYPIASTTKLMTCLLAEEAIANGNLSADTMVTFSKEAETISKSSDGAIQVKEGSSAPVSELIIGALLPSSNECALTLGEAVGGTSEIFVQMMNNKAAELSMNTAVYYNANGLPNYGTSIIPSKRQNHMSSEDMFKLCSYILSNYPQIKDITSMKVAHLDTLNTDVGNTNGLLYNMPEINGMKTGTTDKAGACLVTSLTVNDGTMDHDLVVVLLGAEGSKARLTTSELMARFGKKVVLGEESADGTYIGASAGQTGDVEGTKRVISAETLLNIIVSGAQKLKANQ